MRSQRASTRKRTGGRTRPNRDTRKADLGREPTETTLDEPRIKVIDSRGSSRKIRALSTDTAAVAINGETVVTTIDDVIENDANLNYVRRNIITKGAIIDTPEGRARVTSRPGQTGQVCGVLVEE